MHELFRFPFHSNPFGSHWRDSLWLSYPSYDHPRWSFFLNCHLRCGLRLPFIRRFKPPHPLLWHWLSLLFKGRKNHLKTNLWKNFFLSNHPMGRKILPLPWYCPLHLSYGPIHCLHDLPDSGFIRKPIYWRYFQKSLECFNPLALILIPYSFWEKFSVT
jgi:hypothetical protein